MIELKSYIKHNKQFIDIVDFNGPIEDPNYIEGGITLKINNVELINLEMWDYVDQLWAYFSTGLNEISQDKTFETNFPDQPIKVIFKPIRENILITVKCHSEMKAMINKKEFIDSLSNHALAFFKKLSGIKGVDKNNYEYEISLLKKMKQ